VAALPRDVDGAANVAASERRITKCLDETETAALIRTLPGVYRSNTQDFLLTALVATLAEWTGDTHVRVHL
jgi:hypothetical protein